VTLNIAGPCQICSVTEAVAIFFIANASSSHVLGILDPSSNVQTVSGSRPEFHARLQLVNWRQVGIVSNGASSYYYGMQRFLRFTDLAQISRDVLLSRIPVILFPPLLSSYFCCGQRTNLLLTRFKSPCLQSMIGIDLVGLRGTLRIWL
jgi:hypothetical protein